MVACIRRPLKNYQLASEMGTNRHQPREPRFEERRMDLLRTNMGAAGRTARATIAFPLKLAEPRGQPRRSTEGVAACPHRLHKKSRATDDSAPLPHVYNRLTLSLGLAKCIRPVMVSFAELGLATWHPIQFVARSWAIKATVPPFF